MKNSHVEDGMATHHTSHTEELDTKTRHKKTQLVYLNNNNINEYELRFERAPPNTSIDLDLKTHRTRTT